MNSLSRVLRMCGASKLPSAGRTLTTCDNPRYQLRNRDSHNLFTNERACVNLMKKLTALCDVTKWYDVRDFAPPVNFKTRRLCW